MHCPNCKTNKAIIHPVYGPVACKKCQNKKYQTPGKLPEFTSEGIKRQRKEFADDIEQLHRKGSVNKRWIELYGADEAKKRGVSEQEIKSAKYVYSDDKYYNDNA